MWNHGLNCVPFLWNLIIRSKFSTESFRFEDSIPLARHNNVHEDRFPRTANFAAGMIRLVLQQLPPLVHTARVCNVFFIAVILLGDSSNMSTNLYGLKKDSVYFYVRIVHSKWEEECVYVCEKRERVKVQLNHPHWNTHGIIHYLLYLPHLRRIPIRQKLVPLQTSSMPVSAFFEASIPSPNSMRQFPVQPKTPSTASKSHSTHLPPNLYHEIKQYRVLQRLTIGIHTTMTATLTQLTSRWDYSAKHSDYPFLKKKHMYRNKYK